MEWEHAKSCLDKFKSALVEHVYSNSTHPSDFSIRINPVKKIFRSDHINISPKKCKTMFCSLLGRRHPRWNHKSLLESAKSAENTHSFCRCVRKTRFRNLEDKTRKTRENILLASNKNWRWVVKSTKYSFNTHNSGGCRKSSSWHELSRILGKALKLRENNILHSPF